MSYAFPLAPGNTVSGSRDGSCGLSLAKPITGREEYLRMPRRGHQDETRFFRDYSYESCEGIRQVIDEIDKKTKILFVSGRAGTGKSRLIEYLGKRTPEVEQAVVAPTGIAAFSLGCPTIHSFFRLPVGVVDAATIPEDPRIEGVLRRMDRLVIDEISMVRVDILDAIDARMRRARGCDEPFGGIQVVMVGDFLQLPPVMTDDDRAILKQYGYDTPFAFSAHCLRDTQIRVATLRTVWRQSNPDMIRMLGALREGRSIYSAVNWFNRECDGPHRPDVQPLFLTATRAAAKLHNEAGRALLRAQYGSRANCLEVAIKSEATGVFEAGGIVCPAPRTLHLMPGSRVMALRNDPGGAFANGSLGEVQDIYDGHGRLEDAYVIVRFDYSGRDVCVCPAEWSRTRKIWNCDRDAVVDERVGTYRQIPLAPGDAITIHKSQGLSLEDVRIDLGRGTFAPGQLYVALSRARSIEGLSLTRPLEPRDVKVDEMLVRFVEWARTTGNLDFVRTRT